MTTYNQISQSAVYKQDDVSVSLTVCGGSYGGGSEILVVSDEPKGFCFGIDHVVTTGGNCTAQGPLYYNEFSPTLKAGGVHAVCYGISALDSNAMKSKNPNSGIYEAETSRTLDLNGGNPSCNQGGVAVVQMLAVKCGREKSV